MIPVATLVEVGVRLVVAGLEAMLAGRSEVSGEQLSALKAEILRHRVRWDDLFKEDPRA